jgi:hypothetical protein
MLGAVVACLFCQLASSVHAEEFGLFTYTVIGGTTIEITDYPTSEIGEVSVPDEIDSKPVTSVGDNAFEHCSGLTSITLPSSVTSIGTRAFLGCSSLTGMTLPPGLTSVADFTLYGCSSLTSITLPAGVTSLGIHSLSACSGLIDVTLPPGLITMNDYAFQYCTSLTSIALPPGLTSVGDYAFDGCIGLTSITLPSSVTSVGGFSFLACSSLSAAYFLGDAPTLAAGAFNDTAPDFTIYYLTWRTGYGSPVWNGYTAQSQGVGEFGLFTYAVINPLSPPLLRSKGGFKALPPKSNSRVHLKDTTVKEHPLIG